MSRLELRPATAADALPLADLMERLARRHLLRDCTPAGQRALLAELAPEQLVANLAAGHEYWVAGSGADLLGAVGLRGGSHVHHLYVADAAKGGGLGRRLWETARDQVCIHSTAPPLFTVNSSRPAVGFFQKLGFQASEPETIVAGVPLQPMRYVLLGLGARR